MSKIKCIEYYPGIIRGRLIDIERNAVDQDEKVEKLQAERDQLKAERDGLNRDQTELAARVDELKAQLADQNSVPRIIDREDLKSGQWVAVEGERGHWRVVQVQSNADEAWVIQDSIGAYPADALVLLEDASAEEPEPVKVGDTINTDARAAELPEGTILLDDDADPWRKDKDGYWWAAAPSPGELVHYTTEPVLYTSAPLTVLYLPEEAS